MFSLYISSKIISPSFVKIEKDQWKKYLKKLDFLNKSIHRENIILKFMLRLVLHIKKSFLEFYIV